MNSLTPSQARALASIFKEMDGRNCEDRYEFKELEVDRWDSGTLRVYAVYGLKNDEDTYAQVFGREHWHLFIGKAGGVRQVDKRLKPGRYHNHFNRYASAC